MINACYYIKEISARTGVKAGTIRFYEKIGFLEPVERMPNQYRVFNEHHIYQIQVCSLVFGGFVNTRLRLGTVENAELYSRADQYLKSLSRARTQADTLCHLFVEMKKI